MWSDPRQISIANSETPQPPVGCNVRATVSVDAGTSISTSSTATRTHRSFIGPTLVTR